MNTTQTLAALLCASVLAAAQIPFAYHFEFDQAGVLPSATPGIGTANLTSTPTTSFFIAGCGTMLQQTTINPTLGAAFYRGTFGAYPTVGTGLDPTLPAFIEAKFQFLGGSGGPGTVTNATPVMGIFPGGGAQLLVNVVTGAVGLTTTSGILWTTPVGTAYAPHVYRIETIPSGGGPMARLFIDGGLVFPFSPISFVPSFDGFYMGDIAGSSSISTNMVWSYLSVGQTQPGPGQANSEEAALFVNRAADRAHGQYGLKGPFYSVIPGGRTLTLDWNGPANAAFLLYVGPQNPANTLFGCSGWLDIGTPFGYTDVVLTFDPFNPYSGFRFWLDSCGKSQQTFSIPNWPPGTPIGNFQGAVIQPVGSFCPTVFTAAHYVTT